MKDNFFATNYSDKSTLHKKVSVNSNNRFYYFNCLVKNRIYILALLFLLATILFVVFYAFYKNFLLLIATISSSVFLFGLLIVFIVLKAHNIKLSNNKLTEQKGLLFKKYNASKFRHAYLLKLNIYQTKFKYQYENSFIEPDGRIRFMYPFVLVYSQSVLDNFDYQVLKKNKKLLFLDYKIKINKTILKTNKDIKIHVNFNRLLTFKSSFLNREGEYFINKFIDTFKEEKDRVEITQKELN